MKKNALFLILFLLFAGSAMATNPLSRTGYVGNIACAVTPQLGFGADITTSHGYSFGNGLWVGAGVGVSIASAFDGVFLPLFAETKYSFFSDERVSPFVDCRIGYMTNFDSLYVLFSPTAGIDINKISVFATYSIWAGVRALSFGVALNF